MTTWELIRRLIRADASGDRPVMLSIKTTDGTIVREVTGLIDEVGVELADDGSEFIILEAVDA